jgi:O-antigen/teichoic acid export membrane protein
VIYGFGEIVVMLSGVISLPVLTRWMTEQEYGLMNLIGVTLALTGTIFTGGLRHALARFYGEYRRAGRLPRRLGTYLLLTFALGLAGTAAAMLLFRGLVAAGILPRWALPIASMAAVLVVVRLSFAGVTCVLRMRERAGAFVLLQIVNKYLGMGLCIWFVISGTLRLFQYYRGILTAEVAVLAGLCLLFFRRPRETVLRIDRDAAREMFAYGLPLMAGSLAVAAFHLGDRYVIKLLLDARQVAYYSVGAQLATYTCRAIVSGFQFALVPVIMNAWGEGKRAEAQTALGNLIRYYALAAFPVAVGLIAVRTDLIRLVASAKYLPSGPVVPLVVGGALLSGFNAPLIIGLHFAKRTGVLALLAASMAALNIGLNCALIPVLGIVGAGAATLACSAGYLLMGHLLARKYYSVRIPWVRLAEYALAAGAMYLCVTRIELAGWGAQLAARVAVGVVLYVLFTLTLDGRLRTFVMERLFKRR